MNKRILNAGSGVAGAGRLRPFLANGEWEEVRFDIDPSTNPDVLGSVATLDRYFDAGSFDAILCSHVIEHLFAHEVYPALVQFRRVLKQDGFALIMCPDIEGVARFIIEKGLTAIAYNSPAGPIRPLDMLYGHSRAIEQGQHYMAHRTGFSGDRLGTLLMQAGFRDANVRVDGHFELCALAFMEKADSEAIQARLASSGFDLRLQEASVR